MFARVVVNVDAPGLRQPFTYRVSPDLMERITPGACVVVPFGKREVIGYVVSLTAEAPPDLPDERLVR